MPCTLFFLSFIDQSYKLHINNHHYYHSIIYSLTVYNKNSLKMNNNTPSVSFSSGLFFKNFFKKILFCCCSQYTYNNSCNRYNVLANICRNLSNAQFCYFATS